MIRNGSAAWHSQPESMKTKSYVYGVEKLNGNDAWALFTACAAGDVRKVQTLLAKDRRLVNAQYWYQFPIHMAVREGHAEIVKLLLEQGADPGQSFFTYNSWDKLLLIARERGYRQIESLLQRAMKRKFNFTLDFDVLKDAIIARDTGKISTVLRRHGAYTPPYKMNVQQMKQAIRDGHEVVRHGEFLDNVIQYRDAELLDLYLDLNDTEPNRMHGKRGREPFVRSTLRAVPAKGSRPLFPLWSGVTYPRSPALVRKLLERGLDPNRPDWLGKTFLHACAENGDRAIAAIFLDAGADINAHDLEFKETPLAAAVRCASSCAGEDPTKEAKRSRQMVEFLLQRGAATNLPGDKPWATPLAWAKKCGLTAIEEILRSHGATW